MSNKCYAAIDIGSNAVRLLIKKEKEDENLISKRLSKVMLLRVPLRLGFDVFSLGEVSEIKLVKLRRLMKAFRQLMKIYEVTTVHVPPLPCAMPKTGKVSSRRF